MTEICQLCESDKADSGSEYEQAFADELEQFPQIFEFIRNLQACIKRQRRKIEKLTKKLLNLVSIPIIETFIVE